MLVGLPNRGKVCSEQHLPGFVAAAGELAASGVQLPVLSVSQGEPEAVSSWAEGLGLDPGTVLQVVDRGGRLTRFLGMEHPEAGANVAAGGPAMLRWTALVEDGVLLRLVSCWSLGGGGRERGGRAGAHDRRRGVGAGQAQLLALAALGARPVQTRVRTRLA